MARTESAREQTVFGLPLPTVSLFVLFLVVIDSWLTDQSLASRRGRELNPVMDWLYHEGGALTFVAFKLAMTGLCLLWINRRAPREHARLATIIALAIYLPVAGIHILALYR